jgi:hypothetical protein
MLQSAYLYSYTPVKPMRTEFERFEANGNMKLNE